MKYVSYCVPPLLLKVITFFDQAFNDVHSNCRTVVASICNNGCEIVAVLHSEGMNDISVS